MTQQYDAEHIKVLEGLEAVRKRPGMYIGSTSTSGLNHIVFEVVDNSIDEAMAGYCSHINVTIDEGNIVTVVDNGRGIPIDIHKEKNLPAVEVVMTTLHAGGKFEGEGYKISGGLHGVGVSVVNALSEWLEVRVTRDNKEYVQKYFRGTPKNLVGETTESTSKTTGTTIVFKPDEKIFDTIVFGEDVIAHRLKELAYLNNGITINFKDNRDPENIVDKTYCFEGGITSYVEDINEKKEALFEPPISMKKKRDKYEVELALQYVTDYYDEHIVSFANNIRTKEGGTHLSGFRTALTRVMNSFAKKYDLIQKGKGGQLTGTDLREGLTAIISIKLENPQFEGQTKTKLGNSEVKGIVDSLLDEGLTDYIETNPRVGKLIISKGLAAQRVREAARKAQDLARRKTSLESTTLPGKLADCSEKDPAKCEIFLVEGDSAGGSAKQGRDRAFQAILPLRGKVLNVEKARLDKILANEEIRSLITAVGPEAISGLSTRPENTNEDDEEDDDIESILKKLRYHKVVIMTDADVDGAHIRTLLLTFFFRYARTLIEAGALYIAQPPLYLVKSGKTEKYAYNEAQLEEVLAGVNREKTNIQRYKGLGEMNPEQLWDTTLNPENRTLLQITIEDAETADEIFTLLMGSKVDPRKEFIEKYGKTVRWIDV